MLTDIGVAEGEVEKGLGSVNTVDVVRDSDADANASKVSKGTDAPLITKDAILGELGGKEIRQVNLEEKMEETNLVNRTHEVHGSTPLKAQVEIGVEVGPDFIHNPLTVAAFGIRKASLGDGEAVKEAVAIAPHTRLLVDAQPFHRQLLLEQILMILIVLTDLVAAGHAGDNGGLKIAVGGAKDIRERHCCCLGVGFLLVLLKA